MMRTRLAAALAASLWLAWAPVRAQTSTGQDLFRAGPETYAPRYEPGQVPPSIPYPASPGIVLDDPWPRQRVSPAAARPPEDARGYLSLVVQPITAQIYVDGFFVGSVDDYSGSPGPLLDAGVHRVELRAAGYETAAFDVRIIAGDVVMHRGNLVRAGAQPPARSVQPAPSRIEGTVPGRTFYVIPRCYAGDTPPAAAHLPAGCNVADVRTIPADAVDVREPARANPRPVEKR